MAEAYIQTNFGSTQTNVKYQLYDLAGMVGAQVAVTEHSTITGVYIALAEIGTAVGVQWTCDNATLTRQQDLWNTQILYSVANNVAEYLARINTTLEDIPASFPVEARFKAQALTQIPIVTANDTADALLDRADGIELGITPRQSFRAMLSALAAKLSGAATTSVKIRDAGDTKDRITATVDSSSNRTAVTLDLT